MECTRKDAAENEMGAKILAFFSDPAITQMARTTGFVQRQSRMTGLLFLKTWVMGFLENGQGSISHLAQVCGDLALDISPQGIDGRISRSSVALFAAVLAHALQWFQQQCPVVLALVQPWSAIHIVDSTFLELPAQMQMEYPGAGGKASLASLKIELVFDFISGCFEQISLQAGRSADQAYRDYLKVVQCGSLTLADLFFLSGCLSRHCSGPGLLSQPLSLSHGRVDPGWKPYCRCRLVAHLPP